MTEQTKKAKTNAERQTKFRNRVKFETGRINTPVVMEAFFDLKRLARHHQLSQRKMLEKLIQEAAACTVAEMEKASASDKEAQSKLDAWCEDL